MPVSPGFWASYLVQCVTITNEKRMLRSCLTWQAIFVDSTRVSQLSDSCRRGWAALNVLHLPRMEFCDVMSQPFASITK